MSNLISSVESWRPPVFKSFSPNSNLASAIFGHAFGVAVAFLMYDVVRSSMINDDDEATMSIHLRRFLSFLAAFFSGALAFFIMWFLFGLGYAKKSEL